MIDRRNLLRGALFGAGAAVFSRNVVAAMSRAVGSPFAPVYPNHQVLFVFLRGANDGVNTVVPWRDADYPVARPQLSATPSIAGSFAITGATYARLNRELGRLAPVDAAGRLAYLHQVGDPTATRSHFTAMDMFETAAEQTVTLTALQSRTGFVNRMLQAGAIPRMDPANMPAAISFSGGLQRMFRTDQSALLASHVPDLGKLALPAQVVAAGTDVELAGHAAAHATPPLATPIDGLLADNLGFGLVTRQKLESLGFTPGFATTRLFPLDAAQLAQAKAGLPAQEQRVVPYFDPKGAAFLAAAEQACFALRTESSLRIAGIEFGGWDTHGDQPDEHPNLLRYLGYGLRDLHDAIQSAGLGDRITVVVVSEFGRTARENASASTDHGVGGLYFVMGDRVVPGTYNIHGGGTLGPNEFGAPWRPLLATPGNPAWVDACDVVTDFRHVLAEICDKCFGISATAALDTVIPGYSTLAGQQLGFLV
ncbi:MAG: DUF1501 domain-containing protein [Planctomycetes bacterium]|nr:DUF1501 domain-containing protein [Planctomycetota bacterium]